MHVWCLSCHPGHLMLLSPLTPPCFTYFINVPNCVASARCGGGLQWLALSGAILEVLQPLVSCVTYCTGAPGNFRPPTSHREPGKRTVPLYCLPTPLVPLRPRPPAHPCPGYGHTPSKLSEGTCLAWFGPPSYLQRNDSAWGWGESGYHRPLPWQSPGTPTGRAGSSLSAPPFPGLCLGCLRGQENGSAPS